MRKENDGQGQKSFFERYRHILNHLYLLAYVFYPLYFICHSTILAGLWAAVPLGMLLWIADRFAPDSQAISVLCALEKKLTPERLSWVVILGFFLMVITAILRLCGIPIDPWAELMKNIVLWILLILLN